MFWAMKPHIKGPSPVPNKAAPENRDIGAFRSVARYMSLTTPPTIVENVEPPTPTKNRATKRPTYDPVIPQQSCDKANRNPVAMKTGFRPFSSESGANIMGAIANPTVNVVIPTKMATWLTSHSFCICLDPGLYAPAENAVKHVAIHDIHSMKDFLDDDHSSGLINLERSGWGGRLFLNCCDRVFTAGLGSSVSKVR